MAKKLKRVWLAVEQAKHEKVVEFADQNHRTVQGQYRHFMDLGMMTWEEKITAELNAQLERNRESFQGKKSLLRAIEGNEWDGRERRRQA